MPTSPFIIDLAAQETFPLCELPDHLPIRRGGKKISRATAYRWAAQGLPTIKVGGVTFTSSEAFQWWCESKTVGQGAATPARTVSSRRRAYEKAEKELERLGA